MTNYLSILEKTLLKETGWYTGIPIKEYIKKQYFDKLNDIQNQAIETGRWSCYCHYSDILAFENLLDKHKLVSGDLVLVDPLLPLEFVEILIKKQLNLDFLDIEKTSLTFNSKDLLDYLANKNPKLVILYNQTGIYQALIDNLEILNRKFVDNMLVLDNPGVNFNFLKLVKSKLIGSCLWHAGPGFFDDQLDYITGIKRENKPWFYSWFIENRLSSILEYHLKQSTENMKNLVMALFYLESNKQQNTLGNQIKNQILRLKLGIPFKTANEARLLIENSYYKIYQSAIPDFIFEIENLGLQENSYLDLQLSPFFSPVSYQDQAKNLHLQFTEIIKENPRMAEVTTLKLTETPLRYYFFTTDTGSFQKFGRLNKSPNLHPILNNFNLANVRFVEKYLYYIDLF